ncbi:MAG: GYD domain protein [Bacteroidetes bacterium B1(2017)]|nr:MAG: GYD domain protein [Bacteroidetes bacterium B1(2017)]
MKFLIVASYSAEGAKGVLKSTGGSSRKQATERMINELGGKLESFYYVTNCDAYVTCELPDAAAAAAIALRIKASGFGSIVTHLLLEVEQVDRATALAVHYPGPGND